VGECCVPITFPINSFPKGKKKRMATMELGGTCPFSSSNKKEEKLIRAKKRKGGEKKEKKGKRKESTDDTT